MEDLIQRYNDAWASRDPDAIVALHTEDTTFRYHTGFEAATGKAAVRQAFTDLFARLPDLGLKPVSLRTGSDFWVAEWLMTGTAAASGAKVEVDLVDVITVKGGLVASKDSYVDAVSLQAQLGGETRPRNRVRKVDLMHLEVNIIAVSDVERSKQFYERLGWRLDLDVAPADDVRIVQFTPPGSACSVTFGKGITPAAPGSAVAELTVSDIKAAHDNLVSRGIDASEMWHGRAPFPPEARLSGPDPEHTSYESFFSFNDPDGNTWLVQEVTTRLRGRV